MKNDDPEGLGDPNVGRLGETPQEFERRRIRYFDREAARLNERQADIPTREDFGAEGQSFDTPEMTHDAIARMAAARGKTVRVHAAPAAAGQHGYTHSVPLLSAFQPPEPRRSVPQIFDDNARQEMQIMVQAVVGELGRELAATFSSLKKDLEENTRLLGVMNAPMEAITDSHERASASFETLRADLTSMVGYAAPASTAAIETLTKTLDTAGLSEAQSRAEARFEALATMIEGKLDAFLQAQTTAFKGVALDMTKILHLLERLQARELRELKNRATR